MRSNTRPYETWGPSPLHPRHRAWLWHLLTSHTLLIPVLPQHLFRVPEEETLASWIIWGKFDYYWYCCSQIFSTQCRQYLVAQHSSGLFMTLRQMMKRVRRRFAEQMCGKGTLRGTAALGAKMPSSQSPDVQQGRKANNKFLDCIPIHGSRSCSLLIVTLAAPQNLHGAEGRAAICGKVWILKSTLKMCTQINDWMLGPLGSRITLLSV